MSKYTNRIKNLEKQIKDNLDFFLHNLNNGVVLDGSLLNTANEAVRLKIYKEMEEENGVDAVFIGYNK
jgi:hypothetical protein